jgi:TonB family protein
MGRVTVDFVIGVSGNVVSAVAADSTVPSKELPRCVAQAFRSLQFPEPEGGVVKVRYPVLFGFE